MINIWHWIVIDLIIVMAAHITMIIKGFPEKIKTTFIFIYLIIIVVLSYIGAPIFPAVNYIRIYLPSIVIFCFVLLTVAYMILFAIFNIDKRLRDVCIILFPLVSISLVTHYAHQVELIYLNSYWMQGILGTLAPLILAVIYIKAKFTMNKKAEESSIVSFFIFLNVYLFNLTLSSKGFIIIFPYISFVLFLVVLGFGLAKKLDYVFG